MSELDVTISRRRLLEWAAASATLAACARAPVRKIVPYVVQPPGIQPGRPLHYATAWELDGYAMGLVVESHVGRPTKIEGNPHHPASLGATRAVDQALVEMLYDPDRASHVRDADGPISVDTLQRQLAKKRVAMLLEPTSSRTVEGLVARVRKEIPGSQVWFYSALSRANAWQASELALGRVVEPLLDPSRAGVLVAFGSDFLASGHACVRDARLLADRRAGAGARLYAIESRRTPTGIFADERFAATAHDRAKLACGIAARVLSDPTTRATDALRALATRLRDRAGSENARFVDACARDLLGARGAAAWIAGDDEPLGLHALAWLVNGALGSLGSVVRPVPSPVLEAGKPSFDLAAFESAAASGAFDVVVVCGSNPVYSAPTRPFARALSLARETVYVGPVANETSKACKWLVPLAHPLESWGDVRADDGTGSIAQPLIAPLFDGLTVAEVLALLLGELAPRGHDLTKRALGLADDAWNAALQRGVLADGASAPIVSPIAEAALADAVDAWDLPPDRPLELDLHASHAVHDGRFGTPLLLELPEPVTKLTWGNAAVMSPATASALDVKDADVIEVSVDDQRVALPVLVARHTADRVISIALGWGQVGARRFARDVGASAFSLRAGAARLPATVARTSRVIPLAQTQVQFGLHQREHDVARIRAKTAAPIPSDTRPRLSLYVPQLSPTAEHAWAMTIDLSRCTGCGSCVIACQAENNVPTVGKLGVINGRHMHWLRIDRYDSEEGGIFQPMLCQHCDDAPCEYVCPVNATVHSPDGLNEMIYNRCVGTRWCSNNCPYKVRRFNWFDYHEDEEPITQLEHNPQVTVRARGVMEKCTFCVQRIREAEHVALSDHRELRRDEVVTACQQACPTRAIVFGDKKDPSSAVSRRYDLPEAYGVLDELGTRPRIRYFPKIVDKNPGAG